MRKGFTLVELLAVMGLMGLMAAMAIGGYSAVVRGMSDRAALDAAKSLADTAWQRALMDGKRTQIYLFDEVLKTDTEMSAGVVNGVAIAVRPVGRISARVGSVYCDEFGDLERSYGTVESSSDSGSRRTNRSNMRIYNIAQKDYAIVKEYVVKTEADGRILATVQNGDSYNEEWQVMTFTAYGFEVDDEVNESGGGKATFEAGQEYGKEFSVTRLPAGYTFSQNVNMSGASNLGQHKANVLDVLPTDSKSPNITVYRRRPDGRFETIGSTSSVKDGE